MHRSEGYVRGAILNGEPSEGRRGVASNKDAATVRSVPTSHRHVSAYQRCSSPHGDATPCGGVAVHDGHVLGKPRGVARMRADTTA